MTDAAEEADPTDHLPEDVDSVRAALVEWYEADHREYPWRETTDPYTILVSEVMSQQTQLDRVVDAYEDFLEEWPTIEALAAADRADVVGFWTTHSLGYNNRAKYLHEAARQVREEFDGAFPGTPDGLQALMGVGPYTANAVASFAFNNGNAVVDTNVERVLYRAFDVTDDDEAFAAVASELMPAGRSRVWNNAVMELGGVACGKTPRCDEAGCPWREWCRAYETGDFTAPDVPTQPEFEGSRRQMRGRVISTLKEYDELPLDELGPRVRVDYAPDGVLAGGEGSSEEDSESDGKYGREWLRGLLEDLADDGLVEVEDRGDTVARLRR
ncbi:A/G-specific adenine glycosylase [Halobacteriales archaeon QS_9_68_42]|nr:MAG: A/G-specific adenine glycosylase [Halobacteriales archaeon QS_9_68_42]